MTTYYIVSFIIFCLLMSLSVGHTYYKFCKEKKALKEKELALIKEIREASSLTEYDEALFEFAKKVALALRYEDPTKWECPICRARAGEECDAGLHN